MSINNIRVGVAIDVGVVGTIGTVLNQKKNNTKDK